MSSLFYAAEPLLMAIALVALVRSKEYKRFPALCSYFALRISSCIALYGLIHIRSFLPINPVTAYTLYFTTYWLSYVASAIAVFLVIQEMFKFSMEPLPGLKRLGMLAFRWVAGISLIAGATAMLMPGGKGTKLLLALVFQVMRCESIFILCMLLFLLLAAGKLGLSYRSRIFGISFGFGIMAATDLVTSATFLHFHSNMVNSTVSIITTSATLLTSAVWSAYFLQTEPARLKIALAVSSPLVRWNEIAMAIGPSGGKAASPAQGSDFFLQDVEKVVDRILVKNSLHVAS